MKRLGERFQSNNGEYCTIIEKLPNSKYKIEFDSGFILITTYGAIQKGKIKDGFSKSLAKTGYLGYAKRKGNEKEYNVWMNMIKRCYEESSPAFESYGAKGISVCDRWLCFENFLSDIKNIEGFDEESFQKGKLHLDKDIKQKNKNYNEKVYSLNTCIFTNKKENFQHRNYKLSNKFKAINANGEVFISENLHDFCRIHNISQPNAHRVLNGKLKQTKGWKFYKYNEEVLDKNGKIRGTQ